ncbi:NmrA/HSCARG family protein [Glutamicibacter sp.]|uniref:NmrA/HSCARG family protein n=1 Tax=Glutamicibacter sp. TaxID=1931995 RepID=UPI0028BE9003|nr:NmrA/HSCARG family protein [Glutamicibacter sp.]
MSDSIAVFGATGQQGGSVVKALRERGLSVRALARDPQGGRAQALRELGAQVVAADITDPASITSALQGIDTFVFMTSMDGAGVGSEAEQGKALVDAARAAGVKRYIYNAGAASERPTQVPHFESKGEVERYITSLGLDAYFIHPVYFMDNFQNFGIDREGEELVVRLAIPAGVPLQMIGVKDIGAMTALAVVYPERLPENFVEFAGDELTGEQMAQAVGEHFGMPARYEALPLEVFDGAYDMQQMFRYFSSAPSYRADLLESARLIPGLSNFKQWLRATNFELN